MVFQFELMEIDQPKHADASPLEHHSWKVSELRDIVSRWQIFKRDEGFWNAYVNASFNEPLVLIHDTVCSSRIMTTRARSLDLETTQQMSSGSFLPSFCPSSR